MLNWVGNDQPMKMRETSRAIDKKLWVKNYLKRFRRWVNKNSSLIQQCILNNLFNSWKVLTSKVEDNHEPSPYREGATTRPRGRTLKRVEMGGILFI